MFPSISTRNLLQDHLQSYRFWLMDVANITPASVPVFLPLFGFRSITAPEMSIAVKEISESNWVFPTKVIESASATTLSLERGARFIDSEFWLWIKRAALGGFVPRRNLILMQFFSRGFSPVTLGLAGQAAPPGALKAPARAWFLRNCIPVRYRSASDFDASQSEVSIMGLDIDFEYFSEVSLVETLMQV